MQTDTWHERGIASWAWPGQGISDGTADAETNTHYAFCPNVGRPRKIALMYEEVCYSRVSLDMPFLGMGFRNWIYNGNGVNWNPAGSLVWDPDRPINCTYLDAPGSQKEPSRLIWMRVNSKSQPRRRADFTIQVAYGKDTTWDFITAGDKLVNYIYVDEASAYGPWRNKHRLN